MAGPAQAAVHAWGALLVANAQGELLMRGDLEAGGTALHLPGGGAWEAGTGATAAWRALQMAAGAPTQHAAREAAAALPAVGQRVCLSVAKGEFLELFCSQGATARALGAAAVAGSQGWQWRHPSTLEDHYSELPWRLRRCLHVYGTAFKAGVLDQGRPAADSSACSMGEWAALALRFPEDAGQAADAAQAEAMELDSPVLPRAARNNHEELLRRSLLRRLRAKQAGRATAAQVAAAAAAVACGALQAALRAQRLVGAAYRDLAAARAKAARRAAECAEGCEEDADLERRGCWATLHTRLKLHLVLMKAVVARVKRGASRIGVSHGFVSGLPHKDQYRKVWEEELHAEGEVLEHLRHGISWPFEEGMEEQVEFEKNNNLPSVLATEVPEGSCEVLSPRAWTTQAVEEYVHFGMVKEVDRRDCKLICALSMALKGSGRYRLCLDLRPLNKYLRKLKFTMETLTRVRHLIHREDWLLTIDLESAYTNFHVREDHQCYCCFEWEGRFFQYIALSFGSSAAPFCFQRIMNVISKHLRAMALRMGCYLDDLWFAFKLRTAALLWAPRLESLFRRLGLQLNLGKSVLDPTKLLRILGMDVDTASHTFSVPEKRVAAMEDCAEELLALAFGGQQVRARLLAKMVGRVQSCHVALGPVVRRRTRRCYTALAACTKVPFDAPRRVLRAAWDEQLTLPADACAELRWWADNIRGACVRGGPIAEQCGGLVLHKRGFELAGVACSDTGDWGMGCFGQLPCTEPAQRELGREALSKAERVENSTKRELLGCERALRLFVGPLPDQQAGGELIFLIDNQGAAQDLDVGSSKGELQTVVERIHDHCDLFGVGLTPAWARRNTPEVAACDYQGKRRDDQAWQLAPALFEAINSDARFGGIAGHEVDMFADADNWQLPVFWSRWRCRGSAGLDAFAQDWADKRLFANPPFVLIARVVAEARRREVAITLVCQWDPQRLWWPVVQPDAPEAVAWRRVPADARNYLVEGEPLLRAPKADVYVVRLDFTLQRQECSLRAAALRRVQRRR